MRRKSSCTLYMCLHVKGECFFSLSVIYYVKGNRALGNSILRNFVQVSAKSNNYQLSSIARTIRDWNSLLNRVIEEQSVEAFKIAV